MNIQESACALELRQGNALDPYPQRPYQLIQHVRATLQEEMESEPEAVFSVQGPAYPHETTWKGLREQSGATTSSFLGYLHVRLGESITLTYRPEAQGGDSFTVQVSAPPVAYVTGTTAQVAYEALATLFIEEEPGVRFARDPHAIRLTVVSYPANGDPDHA